MVDARLEVKLSPREDVQARSVGFAQSVWCCNELRRTERVHIIFRSGLQASKEMEKVGTELKFRTHEYQSRLRIQGILQAAVTLVMT